MVVIIQILVVEVQVVFINESEVLLVWDFEVWFEDIKGWYKMIVCVSSSVRNLCQSCSWDCIVLDICEWVDGFVEGQWNEVVGQEDCWRIVREQVSIIVNGQVVIDRLVEVNVWQDDVNIVEIVMIGDVVQFLEGVVVVVFQDCVQMFWSQIVL